jgi:hypothetical protein
MLARAVLSLPVHTPSPMLSTHSHLPRGCQIELPTARRLRLPRALPRLADHLLLLPVPDRLHTPAEAFLWKNITPIRVNLCPIKATTTFLTSRATLQA